MRGIRSLVSNLIMLTLLQSASGDTIAQTADQLGRLFSTPRERMELDEIRKVWLQDSDQTELTPDADSDIVITPSPPANLYLRLEGTVRQADGSYTLWINGDAVQQHHLPDNVRLARVGDLIVLWVNYLDKLFVVRPGQTLHFATEAVYEQYMLPPALASLLRPSASEAGASQNAVADAASEASGTTVDSNENGQDETPSVLENITNIAQTLDQIRELTQ